MKNWLRRRLRSAIDLLFVAGLALWSTGAAGREARPRLVVVVIVDGLPQAQLTQYAEQFGRDGLGRLLREGAWFTNARYGYSATLTAPGHTTILTGADPYVHGIVGNDWMDRDTRQRVYCAEDTSFSWLGEETRPHAGTSPRLLRVSTLGDELRLATGFRAKVVCVSGKDRGAILPAGRLGTAWFYSPRSGRFVTSTYYVRKYPAWWDRYYETRPQDRWRGATWAASLPEGAGQDEPRAAVLPLRLPGGVQTAAATDAAAAARHAAAPDSVSKRYYGALRDTPFGDEYTLEFATAAVRGEGLGRNPHRVPDLLVVSFSGHDAANHRYGPESLPSHDSLLRFDRTLAALLAFLKGWVGLEHTLLVLSADHGFTETPEYLDSLGFDAGRIDPGALVADLNAALAPALGVPKPIVGWWTPTLYLDLEALRSKNVPPPAAAASAAAFLLQQPGIAAVFTREQLESGALPDTRLGQQVQRAWDRERSGDLFLVQQPHWCFLKPGGDAAGHGSRYAYDTNVPLVFLGPWFRREKRGNADVADIAPTLAHVLGVRPPSGSEGRVLDEILVREK